MRDTSTLTLDRLPTGAKARITDADWPRLTDAEGRRLRELGFVQGEDVEVVAAGPLGAEPLLVQVGFTRFALRRAEAARVRLCNGAGA